MSILCLKSTVKTIEDNTVTLRPLKQSFKLQEGPKSHIINVNSQDLISDLRYTIRAFVIITIQIRGLLSLQLAKYWYFFKTVVIIKSHYHE